jgi:DNA-binding transcriptional regulator YbjK
MLQLAERANRLLSKLFDRVSGALRPGAAVHDLSVIFEMLAAVKNPDPQRARELRQRYLAVILDGLRAGARDPLPGAAPTWTEVASRWAPRT